jgi:hypothetical protein
MFASELLYGVFFFIHSYMDNRAVGHVPASHSLYALTYLQGLRCLDISTTAFPTRTQEALRHQSDVEHDHSQIPQSSTLG